MNTVKLGWSEDRYYYTFQIQKSHMSSVPKSKNYQAIKQRMLAVAYNKARQPQWKAFYLRLADWKARRKERFLLRRSVYAGKRHVYRVEVQRLYDSFRSKMAKSKAERRQIQKDAYRHFIQYKANRAYVFSRGVDRSVHSYKLAYKFVESEPVIHLLSGPGAFGLRVPFSMYLKGYYLVHHAKVISRDSKYNKLISSYHKGVLLASIVKSELPVKFTEPRPVKPASMIVGPRIAWEKAFCNPYVVKSVKVPFFCLEVGYPNKPEMDRYRNWIGLQTSVSFPWTASQIKSQFMANYDWSYFYSPIATNMHHSPTYNMFSYLNLHIHSDYRTKRDQWESIHAGQVSNLHNIVLAKIGEKYRGHSLNLGNLGVEVDETIKFLMTSVSNLAKAIVLIKGGRFIPALRAVGVDVSSPRKFLGTVASAELMYSYALAPLIGDVYSAGEAVAARSLGGTDRGLNFSNTKGYRLRSSKSYISGTEFTDSASGETFTLTKKSTYRIIALLGDTKNSDLIPNLVLNDPFQALWEGTFMSFVVDWFYPIQTFLEAMWTVSGNVNIVDAMYSLKETLTVTVTGNGRGGREGYGTYTYFFGGKTVTFQSFERNRLNAETIMPHVPIVRPLDDAGSIRHKLNALALSINYIGQPQDTRKIANQRAYHLRMGHRRR